MYEFINVIKFNGDYFEHGDTVAITKKDGSVTIGSIIIKNYSGSVTGEHCIALDVSEPYHSKRNFIYPNDIKDIKKVG